MASPMDILSAEVSVLAGIVAPSSSIDIEFRNVIEILNNVALNSENNTLLAAVEEIPSKICLFSPIFPTTVRMAATPLVAWMVLVVMGTVVAKSPFGSLSLTRSWNELFAKRQSRLNVLDCFRVIAILWVMLNHTGSEGRIDILDRLPSADAFKHNVHTHPVFGALLGNSALGVEVFLVLSGLLGTRSWLRSASTPFSVHYRSFIGRRMLRLFPSVAFFIYIAAGPIMKTLLPRYTNTMIVDCGLSGLASHLSFTGNWQSTPTCMGYLWYLGLDMQLHLVLPFLLHLLHQRPRLGISVTVAAVVVSSIIRAVHCRAFGVCNKSDVDIPFISYPDSDPVEVAKVYEGLWDLYARPYTKCGPFLIGVLIGYATMFVKAELSHRTSRLLFSTGAALCVATIYSILPEYWYPEMTANIYNTTYTATFRSVFAVGVSTMIAALYYRKESVDVSPWWSVLARLTFNAYLLHMPIVYIFNHLPFLQTAEGALGLLAVLPLVSILSFGAALVFYLFVEAPLGNVSNQFATKIGL